MKGKNIKTIQSQWKKIHKFTDNLLDNPDLQPKNEEEAVLFLRKLKRMTDVIRKAAGDTETL